MFDLGILDKAKSIVSGDTPTAERIGTGLELAGAASQMAAAHQQANPNPNPGSVSEAKDRLESSQAGQTLKTAASAVAAYFTGGLSAMAQSVGGGVLAKNNPQAAGIAGIASKVFGG